MKKILALTLIILTLAAGALFYNLKTHSLEITITQDQIDQTLSQRFPLTKTHLRVLDLTYDNPKVTFLENENRVQVSLEVTLSLPLSPQKFKGSATVITGIRYQESTKEFFLANAEITQLEIPGIPEKWIDPIMKIAPIAAKDFIESKKPTNSKPKTPKPPPPKCSSKTSKSTTKPSTSPSASNSLPTLTHCSAETLQMPRLRNHPETPTSKHPSSIRRDQQSTARQPLTDFLSPTIKYHFL